MFDWKILGVTADDKGLITQARYFVSIKEGKNTVETEGNWYFIEPSLKVPFDKVTEQNVIDWVKSEATQDGKNIVESRLQEQLTALILQRETVAPWAPQVFTVKL